jgi:hypothetical protein
MGWVRGWVECVGAAGTPSLHTVQNKAEPRHCSPRVASIIERTDLDWASNLMGVIISLTTPEVAVHTWQLRFNGGFE